MDFLLSLPIVSFFLAPSLLTSWSASLNLLFFYMTWTTLILSQPPLKVHLVGILAIRLAFWLLPSLLFLGFDLVVPSLAESLKLGGRSALPPRDGRRITRMLGLALFNLALVVVVEGLSSLAFLYTLGQPEFRTSTTLPLPWQMLKHILALLTARELMTYYIHKHLLHGSSAPRAVSRRHARYAHARAGAPFSLQLYTDHPLPLLLHRFVPIYLPALLVRPHLLVYFLFIGIATLEETLAMSGYNTIPGIIMGGVVQRTAIHYAGKGTSNYGSWGLLDWAHGTSRGRDVLADVRDEADKHNVKERSQGVLEKSSSVLEQVTGGGNGNGNGGGSDSPKRDPRTRGVSARGKHPRSNGSFKNQ